MGTTYETPSFESGEVFAVTSAMQDPGKLSFTRDEVAMLLALSYDSGYRAGWHDVSQHRDQLIADALSTCLSEGTDTDLRGAMRRHLTQADAHQRRLETHGAQKSRDGAPGRLTRPLHSRT